MANRVRLNPHLDRRQLESRLQHLEAAGQQVIGLGAEGEDTVVDVKEADKVLELIRLVLDPDGNLAPVPGETLVARGDVFIGGSKQKIAAFRRGA